MKIWKDKEELKQLLDIVENHPPLYFVYCYNKYKVEKKEDYCLTFTYNFHWFSTPGDYPVTDMCLNDNVFLTYKEAKLKCNELNKEGE